MLECVSCASFHSSHFIIHCSQLFLLQSSRAGQGLPADTAENTHCFFAGLGYDARMLQVRWQNMWAAMTVAARFGFCPVGSTELGIVFGKLNSWSASFRSRQRHLLDKTSCCASGYPPVFLELPPHHESAFHTPAQDYMWLRDKTKDQRYREPLVARDVVL